MQTPDFGKNHDFMNRYIKWKYTRIWVFVTKSILHNVNKVITYVYVLGTLTICKFVSQFSK